MVNLSTRRKTIAKRPKRYNTIKKIQTESLGEGMEIVKIRRGNTKMAQKLKWFK